MPREEQNHLVFYSREFFLHFRTARAEIRRPESRTDVLAEPVRVKRRGSVALPVAAESARRFPDIRVVFPERESERRGCHGRHGIRSPEDDVRVLPYRVRRAEEHIFRMERERREKQEQKSALHFAAPPRIC